VLFRMRFRSDDRLERMCRAANVSDGHTVTHGRICFASFQEVVLKNTVCGVLQRLLGAACAAAAAAEEVSLHLSSCQLQKQLQRCIKCAGKSRCKEQSLLCDLH
jgi:hypothetical protein